jgi:hypothetical protein
VLLALVLLALVLLALVLLALVLLALVLLALVLLALVLLAFLVAVARAGVGGLVACLFPPIFFNYPNAESVGLFPSILRWSRNGSN